MYTIVAKKHFDSAHFLKGYNGPCANMHGHRWVVEAEAAVISLIEAGEKRAMVMDFGDLKKALELLVKPLDHQLIYEEGSLSQSFLLALAAEGFSAVSIPVRPTAEALAKWFFECLEVNIPTISKVTVYETPDNAASYWRD